MATTGTATRAGFCDYVRAQELGPWLDRVAVRGEIVVQFWRKPGEAAVTLGSGVERWEDKIPEQLKRFL